MTFGANSLSTLVGFVFAALRDPENAAIKLLEDFEKSDTGETGKIMEFVCKKFKCEDVTAEVRDNKLVFVLHGTDETGEEIIQFMLKVLKMFAFMLTEEQLTKIKGAMQETVFAYYPDKKQLDVEIEVNNEKILEKLKEMKKEGTEE